jgi:NADPH2:quinone reductase
MRVIGTAGDPRKRSFVVQELGAEACFDSRSEWEEEVRSTVGERGIDVALDSVGGSATPACRRLLAPLGRLVFYGLSEAMPSSRKNWVRAVLAWLRTRRLHPLSLIERNAGVFGIHLLHLQSKQHILRPALEQIYDAVAAGELRPVVDRVFPLDRVGAVSAHRYIHARMNLGKVILGNIER